MKITFEFATQDDCLDKLVPSDLRALVVERDSLIAKLTAVQEVVDHYRTRQVPAVNAIEEIFQRLQNPKKRSLR